MVGIDPLADSSSAPKALPEDTSDFGGEEGMPLSPDQHAVQFTSSDNNGDAKVELGASTHPPHFVGLGKEELMKYANDPFWVRLRWTLFILFWLLWIAMLAGAIVIIVLAPKCNGPSTQGKTYYEIQFKTFTEKSTIEEIESRIDYLKSLDINGIILSQPLESEEGGTGAINFKKINPKFGTNENLSILISKMKKEDMFVMIELFPNHVSIQNKLFLNNTTDMFVKKKTNKTNNWMAISKMNKTAWPNPNNLSEPYLHLISENDVDLNYDNSEVIDNMKSILKSWKDIGVSGFLLNGVSYLYDDLESETVPINHQKNLEILKKLQSGTTLLGIDDMSPKQISEYYTNGLSPIIRDLSTKLAAGFSAMNLYDVVKPYENDSSPVWQLSTPYSGRFTTLFPDKSYLLTMVSFTLPGGVILLSGDESGHEATEIPTTKYIERNEQKLNWNSTASPSNTILNYTKDLISLHRGLTEKGDIEFYKNLLVQNVFAFHRKTSKNKYLVVLNVGSQEQVIQFSDFPNTSGKVVVKTPKLSASFSKGSQIALNEFGLPGLSGIVVEFT